LEEQHEPEEPEVQAPVVALQQAPAKVAQLALPVPQTEPSPP
jgi:hypothetical protein